MKRSAQLLVALIVLQATSQTSVYAEPISLQGLINQKSMNSRESMFGIPSTDSSESGKALSSETNVQNGQFSGEPSFLELNTNKPCVSGEDSKPGECENEFEPISNRIPAAAIYLKPNWMYSELLWDSEFSDMNELNAASKLSVQEVTKRLVESGVAAGDASAKNLANFERLAMFQAEIFSFLADGGMTSASYLNCMQQRFAEGYTPFDAQTYCRGDEVKAVVNEGGVEKAGLDGNGWEYNDTDGHSSEVEGAVDATMTGTPGDGESAIALSALWSKDGEVPPDGEPTDSMSSTLLFKRDIINIIGDIHMKIKLVDSGPTGADIPEITFELMDPVSTPDETIQWLLHERFNRMMKIIYGFCEYDTKMKIGSGGVFGSFTAGASKLMGNWERNFVMNGYMSGSACGGLTMCMQNPPLSPDKSSSSLQEDMLFLSGSGLPFNAAVVDLFTDRARDEFLGGSGSAKNLLIWDTTSDSSNAKDCQIFKVPDNYVFLAGTKISSINQLVEGYGRTTRLFQGMLFFAKWMAIYHFLDMLSIAEKDLYHFLALKEQSPEKELVKMAIDRIYEVAETSDLHGAKLEVSRKLQEYLTYEFTSRDNRGLRAVQSAGGLAE
ncbi:MAG: hypothetical protein KDD53_01900 [Bdellovibrionales bacterium]|nr:hypothetical protein [Bdellovibrionales bacterium]